MNKADLPGESPSKLLTLDLPYIEMTKQFLGAIRIDCDRIFDTIDQLKFELQELIDDQRIPCLPHLICGDLLESGRYIRPHLYFFSHISVPSGMPRRIRGANKKSSSFLPQFHAG